MPTYEYRCQEGHHFEAFQRMSDPPLATCPTCGAEAQRQLSGGAGLLFKGSGFYITDYRSDAYKKAAEKESGGGKEQKGEAKKGGEGGSASGGGGGGGASSNASSGSAKGGSGSGGGGSAGGQG